MLPPSAVQKTNTDIFTTVRTSNLMMLLIISGLRLIKETRKMMPVYVSSRLRTRNARIALRKARSKRFIHGFYLDYVREFFLYTSQHGYKYIAQPNRTAIER
jgi:hypothetical protein